MPGIGGKSNLSFHFHIMAFWQWGTELVVSLQLAVSHGLRKANNVSMLLGKLQDIAACIEMLQVSEEKCQTWVDYKTAYLDKDFNCIPPKKILLSTGVLTVMIVTWPQWSLWTAPLGFYTQATTNASSWRCSPLWKMKRSLLRGARYGCFKLFKLINCSIMLGGILKRSSSLAALNILQPPLRCSSTVLQQCAILEALTRVNGHATGGNVSS